MGADGRVKFRLEGVNLPLGVLEDAEFHLSDTVPLAAGDSVVLFTDGILESASPAGVPFGWDRLIEVLRDHREKPALEIVHALRQAIDDHVGMKTLLDDVTVVVAKVGSDLPSP
jgi:serine phosphatase RsbU (regulator of sigma subunit)